MFKLQTTLAFLILVLPFAVSGDSSCAELSAFRRQLQEMRNNMHTVQNDIATLKTQSVQGSSVIYTRWGRKTCPSSAELVYSGYTGGSHYRHIGGAAEFVCLPREPQWGTPVDGRNDGFAFMYGTEYQWHKKLYNHDVPCAVCWSKGPSVIKMIPARTQCYKGWTAQYQGNLVAGYHGHASATQYVCLDSNPESLHSSISNHDGRLMYGVKAKCGSLKCPPYKDGKTLTCVVCTR